jgi:hypothetical protein
MTPYDSEFPSDPRLLEMGAYEEADARRLLKAQAKYPDDVIRMSCVSDSEAATIRAKLVGLGGDMKRVFFMWAHSARKAG